MPATNPRDDLLTIRRLAVLPLLQLDHRGVITPRVVRTGQHHVEPLGRLRQGRWYAREIRPTTRVAGDRVVVAVNRTKALSSFRGHERDTQNVDR